MFFQNAELSHPWAFAQEVARYENSQEFKVCFLFFFFLSFCVSFDSFNIFFFRLVSSVDECY